MFSTETNHEEWLQERKIAFTAKIKNLFCIDVDYNLQAIGYFFAINA